MTHDGNDDHFREGQSKFHPNTAVRSCTKRHVYTHFSFLVLLLSESAVITRNIPQISNRLGVLHSRVQYYNASNVRVRATSGSYSVVRYRCVPCNSTCMYHGLLHFQELLKLFTWHCTMCIFLLGFVTDSMEKHVYSILAKIYTKERKKAKPIPETHTKHSYTTQQTHTWPVLPHTFPSSVG